MVYAVISSGAKQYKVELGKNVEVETLEDLKDTVTFDQVLLVVDGEDVQVGKPLVAGVKVVAEVVEAVKKGEKLRIFKYKAKSRYRKNRGHRQTHTLVKVISIGSHKLEAKAVKTVKAVKEVKKTSKPKVTTKKTAPKK